MTKVSFRITHPSTGELLTGRMTLTPRHAHTGRPIIDSGAVVSGSPIVVKLSGEPVTIDLRGSGPDWRYDVVGQDESGWRFSESVRVPMRLPDGTESIDYGDLERVDPRAGGIPFTPDPAWWALAREIQSLGGIPGESFKAAMERHYQRSLTDAELANLMRGAKGDPGDPGRDGETYLDFFRQEVDNPQATREDYHEWIRGRTALEQWATYVGEDPAEAEVSDMLEWLRVDAFKLWKEHQGRPSATLDDFFDHFKGEKGDPSTVPGPRGERGKSAFQSVVDSGYGGTEQEFADALIGGGQQWLPSQDQPGGAALSDFPIRSRILDGKLDVAGITRVNDPTRPLAKLASGARPDADVVRHVGTAAGTVERVWLRASGDIEVHPASQTRAQGRLFYCYMELPTAQGSIRPRIPGPAGLSAVELLQQDGLDLPAAEITRRLRVLVEGVE